MAMAIVTGGNGGLGSAVAAELTRSGMMVKELSRTDADLTDADAVQRCFAAMEVPDLLVCAAGVTRDRLLPRLSEENWDEVLGVNLRAAFLCARAVAGSMLKRRSGHIVFISSFSAIHPPAGQSAYAAAKAGLLGLTRSLAKEFGPRGVRVNAVLPGFLETPMTANLQPSVRAAALAAHVLGRFNQAAQVAAFIRCLHLEMNATSGQVFNLDSRVV
jgi:3-oxoacyl-[acyl-carrier protein] reductase